MKNGLILGLLVSGLSSSVLASEGGTIGYPLGVDAMYSGVMFKEGLTAMLTYQYSSADRVNNSNGNQPEEIDSFKMTSHALSPRFDYIWPDVKFLGANVGSRVTLAFPDVDVKNEIHHVGNVGGSNKGIADSSIAPIVLGWHGKQLHQMAGLDITLPIGKYDKDDAVNVGSGHSTYAPYYAFTWFDRTWDLSGKMIYAINSKNSDTDYKSGDELIIESSLGYHLNEKATLGITGYAFKQLTDDKKDGKRYLDGYRGQVMALGPYVSYQFKPGKAMILRGYKEFDAENRTEGMSIFTSFMYHFD